MQNLIEGDVMAYTVLPNGLVLLNHEEDDLRLTEVK